MVPSTKTDIEVMSDKEKSYVTFDSTEIIGAEVMEYMPEDETFKPVIILTWGKFIYPIDAGTHYFYAVGGGEHDFIKVEALKSKQYYIAMRKTVGWVTSGGVYMEPRTEKEGVDMVNKGSLHTLVQYTPAMQEWFDKTLNSDTEEFRKTVKERFIEWQEDDMKDKTLHPEDGFALR
jgi:hypothetical protein